MTALNFPGTTGDTFQTETGNNAKDEASLEAEIHSEGGTDADAGKANGSGAIRLGEHVASGSPDGGSGDDGNHQDDGVRNRRNNQRNGGFNSSRSSAVTKEDRKTNVFSFFSAKKLTSSTFSGYLYEDLDSVYDQKAAFEMAAIDKVLHVEAMAIMFRGVAMDFFLKEIKTKSRYMNHAKEIVCAKYSSDVQRA